MEVWKKSHELTLEIYKITNGYLSEERFGLISQMRRAAVSVPANIAKGFKKRSYKDKLNFYNIAQGSLEELRYYSILSKDLGYYEAKDELDEMIDTIGKMLYRLIESIKNK